MSLRPIAAQWFELVTVHKELARVMECLSRTGAVELEARSRATDRLLFPGLDDELKAHRELARRYQHYWPAAAAVDSRRSGALSDTLKSARARLAEWSDCGRSDHRRDRTAVAGNRRSRAIARGPAKRGDRLSRHLHLLAGAGPKLQVRLLALPAGTLPRELPALVLFKPWQTPDANYALVRRPAGRHRRHRSAASGPERPPCCRCRRGCRRSPSKPIAAIDERLAELDAATRRR